MLSEKQIKDVREWLDKSQNPLFFFDNDVDGLCSFLLFRRCIQRGFGVVVKSYPDLNESYTRKIDELNPDIVFVLDKPVISNEFIDYCNEKGLPIIWVDHHPLQLQSLEELKEKNVFYYNPLYSKEESVEPTSYLCYKIANNKQDMWISFVGCLGDHYIPEFTDDFSKEYNDLLNKKMTSSDMLYTTEVGRLSKILSFALKDRTSNVTKMLKKLWEVKSPYEILNDDSYGFILNRYHEINKKYTELLEKAKEHATEKKLLFFQYSGDLSISGDLANELAFLYPDKIIVVSFVKEGKVNMSLRGKEDVREILKKALEGSDGTGGGHKYACGGTINAKDLQKFKSNLANILNENEGE